MTSDGITPTLASPSALCTTTILPSLGIISVSGKPDSILTLQSDVIFRGPCPTAQPTPTISVTVSSPKSNADASLDLSGDNDSGADDDRPNKSPHLSDFRDPFFASSFPICYALASTTVTAYMLVIMLFITPRSFFDSGVVYLGRPGGFTNSSSAGVNIGRRPWLQKVAALTVAISLTIATADTFKIAKVQYIWGVQNAKVLQNEVMGSTELKAIRLISDTFLWLAQAQTLIRLFPRQREKIIIKWSAVALISLDVIFSALNSFIYTEPGNVSRSMPKGFNHPIPALGYLFQLSLGVLYAAWVIYYALMKKRYAFYHPLMKNMCLVAIMSLTAIVIPVVFFILDISKPQFTGWGDYVRWVGAAAASVVVWEWVERIEALEREEKKDGILGREVFDGDDTLQVTASELPWRRNRKGRRGDGSPDGDDGAGLVDEEQQQSREGHPWSSVPVIGSQFRDRNRNHIYHENHDAGDAAGNDGELEARAMGEGLRPPTWLTRPAPAVTPNSRTDTPSAESTVYADRYQGGSGTLSRTPDPPIPLQNVTDLARQTSISQNPLPGERPPISQTPMSILQNGHVVFDVPSNSNHVVRADHGEPNSKGHWQTLVEAANPLFSRHGGGGGGGGGGSGSETWSGQQSSDSPPNSSRPRAETESRNRWDIRARLEEFAANQAEKMRERLQPTTDTNSLPVTVIPAPARRGAALQQVLEEEGLGSSVASAIRRGRRRPSDAGDDLSSSEADHEMAGSGGRRNTGGRGTSPDSTPVAQTTFPLWPGVRHRQMTYEDDDEDDDVGDGDSHVDSIMESLSIASHSQERELEVRPEPEPDPDRDRDRDRGRGPDAELDPGDRSTAPRPPGH